MKPVQLEMTGFGAYPGTEILDFGKVEPYGLFLIHGVTGSGKSTLFDAMSYALFGDGVSGREKSELRSEHIGPDVETVVRFWFQHHGVGYKIERKPEQLTGNRTTPKPASALLQRVNALGKDAGEPISGVQQVNDKVKAILGIDARQFRQLVMLPQGEFRELLIANTKQKEEILSRLFATEVYESVTAWLEKQAKGLEQELHTIRHCMQLILQEKDAEEVQQLQAKRDSIAAQHSSNTDKLSQLQEQRKVLADRVALDERIGSLFAELEKKRVARHLHLDTEQQVQEWQRELAVFKKIQPLIPEVKRLKELEQECSDAEKAIKIVQSQLDEVLRQGKDASAKRDEILKAQADLPEKEAKLRRWKSLQPKMEDFGKKEEQVNALQLRQKDCLTTIRDLEQQRSATKTEAEAVHQTLETLRTSEQQLRSAERAVAEFSAVKRQWNLLQKGLVERNELQAKLSAKARDGQTELTVEKQRYTVVHELEWKRMAHHAGILAEQLKEGEACPVCGSIEHPHPAQHEGEVQLEDLEKARKAYEESKALVIQLNEQVRQLEEQLEKLKHAHVELSKELNDWADKTPFEMEMLEAEHHATLNQAENQHQQALALREQKQKLDKVIQQLNTDIERWKQEESDVRVKLTQLQTEADALRAELPEGVNDAQTFLTHYAALEAEVNQAKHVREQAEETRQRLLEEHATLSGMLKQHKETLEKYQNQHATQSDKVNLMLRELGVTSVEALPPQIRWSQSQADTLQQTISTWEKERDILNQRIAELEQELNNRSAPDMVQLRAKLSELDVQVDTQMQHSARLNQESVALVHALQQYQLLEQEVVKMHKHAGPLLEVKQIFSGSHQSGSRIKLQTYVLSVLLDEVLMQCNSMLRYLSNGRYTLLRTDETKGGGFKGLDLHVFDYFTGKERSVKTLSGGEMFYTSLALALGLAEVASHHAGGIQMDAIFIDEGFGTLDNETLDLAISTLMNVQSQGRLVGIISHVNELKERIKARIEVEKTNSGSRLRYHLA